MQVQASPAIPEADTLPPYAKAFVATVVALGVVVVLRSVSDLLSDGVSGLWLGLLALTIVIGAARLQIPAMPISFSISDTFSIIAALVVGPAAGAITAAVDGLVVSLRMSSTRRSVHRVLFNMAAPAIATWTAAHLFFMLSGPRVLTEGPSGALRLLALLSTFALVDFAVNTGTVAIAIGMERRSSIVAVWKSHFVTLWITYFGGAFAAMLMIAVGRMNPLEGLILLAPLPVILYVTFQQAQGRAQDQIQHLGKMNKVYVAAIEALSQAVDTKDQVTHDHTRRVQKNAVRLAQALDVVDEMELQAIRAAALLHDVGKIGVPEHILNKPGRLSRSEFEIMKQHAPMGADILSVIGFPYPVVPIVRHHHENWDGSGYPDGLSGTQIPIGARILAVVDCFDALTSDRPYRRCLPDREALAILADRRGNMYDPRVVEGFFALYAAERGDMPVPCGPAAGLTAGPRLSDGEPAERVSDVMPARAFYDLGRGLQAAMANQSERYAVPTDVSGWAHFGDAIWHHLTPHVGAAAFVLFAYEAESDSLAAVVRHGEDVVAAETRIPLGERLSGWVAATGQGIFNSDARLELDEETRETSPLRSALAVPVVAGEQTIAVLAFYTATAEGFTDAHRRIAEEAARLASEIGFTRSSLPLPPSCHSSQIPSTVS